jgi:protein involved in polysaccharide export with SLBB domain
MIKSALKILLISLLCAVAFTLELRAQTVPADNNKNGGNKNFPFSQNPKRKPKPAVQNANTAEVVSSTGDDQAATGEGNFEGRSSAEKLASVSRTRNAAARNAAKPATELYRIGNGDVLDIRLLNTETKDSTLFTVMDDGSIDYPLAGGSLPIGGMTVDEVEEMLTGKVRLYENPEFSVTVRNFTSHAVTVLGQVEKPGNKALRREAVPLYVLLAEVIPNSTADRAVIVRADRQTINVNLEEAGANDTLVYPGDVIRITSTAASAAAGGQFYYISGVQSPGEKNFRPGLTLTQAILACGGLMRQSASKIFISRQNEQGLLVSTAHNLKDIREGKNPDPVIQAGDRIEVKN